jgi:polysaccharide biosynthesis/export protein
MLGGFVGVRALTFAVIAAALAGCSETWEQSGPSSPPGGTGIVRDGSLVEGRNAFSSVSQLPTRSAHGPASPYTEKGTAASYEFKSGYRVGAGDRLTIRVAGELDLSSEYVVDPAGNISLPYVQTISVAGMTTPQIEGLVTKRLRAGFLRDPRVSVQATSLRPFYILGEVNTAGSFAYQAGMTVQNAIAIAGGYGTRGDQGDVLITRKNSKGTVTYKVPVTTQVYPGDVVYVRERWF